MRRETLAIVTSIGLLVQCVPNDPAPRADKQGSQGPAKAGQHIPPKLGGKASPSGHRPPPPRPARQAPRPLPDPVLTAPWRDDFERATPGSDWRLTSSAWRIDDGKLCVQRARNHPAWLAKRLPRNARIEFDATSFSPDGDIKAEIWGDGRGEAHGATYDHATSYLTIFGGWKNQFHVLARINEHATDRKEIRLEPSSPDPRATRVAPNQTYHFKIERTDGKTVRWYVDDLEILTYADPRPLLGPGHDHFGFNDWDVRVCFDNLSVTPL